VRERERDREKERAKEREREKWMEDDNLGRKWRRSDSQLQIGWHRILGLFPKTFNLVPGAPEFSWDS